MLGHDETVEASEGELAADDSGSAAAQSSGRSISPGQRVACVGMRLGRYELTRELGEGGMATVFEARDTQLNRLVAVKVMFPHLARRQEAASRFKREARAAAGLDHKHILRVFDVGGGEVVDDTLEPPYIVLELIDGASLDELFKDKAAPLAEIVAAIGVALCRALSVAHAQRIVHRDIKPANVMVTSKGRLVLADFGVARVGEDDSVVTRTGTILGTPAYMSPEQACSEEVDIRSDLYSLGATLYRLATGSLPYSGTTAQVVAAMLDDKRLSVEQLAPGMGRELSRVIDTLMARDPSDRYQSPQAAEEALVELVASGGFADPELLLVEYFCDPVGSLALLRNQAVSGNLRRARRLAEEKRVPLALSLAQRVLCLEPANHQAEALVNALGRRQGQRMWVPIVAPMAVTAAIGIFFQLTRPERVAVSTDADAGPRDAADKVLPAIQDPSLSSDAGLLWDAGVVDPATSSAKRSGPSARPVRDKPDVAPLVFAVDAAVASISEEVAIVKAEPAQLIVAIKPWCDVSIDGKAVGRASSSTSYSLEAGPHSIVCEQPTGLRWQQDIVLTPGQHKTLNGTVLPVVTLRLELKRGQRVKIGSELVLNGKQAQMPGGRYLVEVQKQNGELVDSRYLVLRESCTLKDSPRIACFSD